MLRLYFVLLFLRNFLFNLQDILSKVWLMGQMGPRAICILSATGAVSSAVIRTSADLGYIRYEACFSNSFNFF